MNSPSPLVPQGAIPPKNTSRSARVLLIGFTVVFFHVAGLGVVLMQGCQKDGAANASASATETNTATGLSLPAIDNTASANQYYSSASNLPPAVTASVATTNPQASSASATLSGATNPGALGTSGVAQANPVYTYPVQGAPVTNSGFQEPPITNGQQMAGEEAPTGATSDYKIVARDTLSGIASRNRVSLSALLAANPNLDPKKLKIGQTIKVPAPAQAAPTATASLQNGGSTGVGGGSAAGTYKVKPGDTLTKIARAHGITISQLRAANNMRTTQLLAGRVLKIPAKTQNSAAVPVTKGAAQY